MTDAQIKAALESWVKDYCRDDFAGGIPGGVKVFLDRAFEVIKSRADIQSESLGDHSISYIANKAFSPTLMALLHPYRRAGGLK